jgi:hypothetical protein
VSDRPNQQENYALQEQYNPRTGNWLSDTKDILLRFLQDFFFQMPVGEQPSLFHFEPDGNVDYQTAERETEVIITDAGSVGTDAVEKRPAIIVSRGPFAYGNTSLDHLLGEEGTTGKRTHTDLITGSYVINCVSRLGLEAERLALLVAKSIRIYRRELQKAGFFHIGGAITIGQESPAGALVGGDSDEDFINVPVMLPVYYQESWTIQPDAVLLQKLTLKVYAVLRDFQGDLLSPDALDEDGNPVETSEGVIVQEWTLEE